jgi:hypothetical protein
MKRFVYSPGHDIIILLGKGPFIPYAKGLPGRTSNPFRL